VTVAQILQQAGMPTLDLLQIDAEGHDYEILKSLDLASLRPAILRFEFSHFSGRERDECLHLLASLGYRFIFEQNDVIALQAERAGIQGGPAASDLRNIAARIA
jgi:hypothetical protein